MEIKEIAKIDVFLTVACHAVKHQQPIHKLTPGRHIQSVLLLILQQSHRIHSLQEPINCRFPFG